MKHSGLERHVKTVGAVVLGLLMATSEGTTIVGRFNLWELHLEAREHLLALFDREASDPEGNSPWIIVSEEPGAMTEAADFQFRRSAFSDNDWRMDPHHWTLTSGSDFPPHTAKINLAGFKLWREQYFPDQLDDLEISGPDAAPSGDGVKNLIKYALGFSPWGPIASSDLPQMNVTEEGEIILVYRERTDVSDIQYIPEVSTDLLKWQSGEPRVWELFREGGDEPGFEEVGVRGDFQRGSRGFLRLKVRLKAEDIAPPNVLFISIDDLNDWTGGLNGHPNAMTPNIDALGERGILFTNAHVQAPLCGPSRASFMTGLQPTTTGIYLHINDRDVRSAGEATKRITVLPVYFQYHGYKTMGVGKIWHGNDLANTFEEYGRRHEWFGPIPNERINYDPRTGPNYDGMATTGTDWGAFPDRDDEMPDHYYASWAIERLKQDHERPFFLAVGFVRPHVPWYVPPHWLEKHPLNGVILPPYREDDMDDIPEVGRRMTFMPPMPTTEYLKERNQWKKMVQAYLASSTWVDHQVGRVLHALAESPYADNTIIVLFSDHGYHLGEKNRVAKMSLWERDTRVPLVFAGPGIDEGLRSSRPVGLIDMYPTLLDLTGLPPYARNEGRSLTPLMTEPDRDWPYPAMTAFGPRNISLRSDDFRYIQYEDGSEEFYDHRNDPNEWLNLANDPQKRARYESVITRMRELIPEHPARLSEKSSFDMNPYFRERMPAWREGN